MPSAPKERPNRTSPGDTLRELVERAPAFVWRTSASGEVVCQTERWSEYTGLPPHELLEAEWLAAIHPDDARSVRKQWQVLLQSKKPGELHARIRRFDGEYRWFLIRAVPDRDEKGNIIAWFGSSIDIDELKRTEKKLRHDHAELSGMVDAIPQLITVLSTGGHTLYANRSVAQFTGLPFEETLSESYRERVFHPDDVAGLRVEREQGLAGRVPFELEQRVRSRNGHYRWYLTQYNPLLGETGEVVRWYATGTDIDRRKRAEDQVRTENIALREDIVRSSMFEEIIGSSAALRTVLKNVERVAPSDATVLILGETGTGKELIARAVHRASHRSGRAFVRVNCAAMPAALIASELFGHEKGAFTGATQRRLGRFEAAEGGTIFLDEIGDLPLETQISLLRVLQEREFERLGSSRAIPADVRVIAATNRDLNADVRTGIFRQDLFYRLNVFPIEMPSLRERADDIPLLLTYFIERYARKAGKKITSTTKRTVEMFQTYDWPGNIRELQNVIERGVLLCDGDPFTVDDAWFQKAAPAENHAPGLLTTALEGREKQMIEAALTECNGRIAGPRGAAARLGMPRQTLDSRIASLKIVKSRFKSH